MKKGKIIVAVHTLVFTMLCTFGCTGQTDVTNGDGYSADVIRIHCGTGAGQPALQLLMLSGLLEEKLPEGVSVEWNVAPASAAIRDAVAAGQVDISTQHLPSLITLIENDLPFVMMFGSNTVSTVLYSANPDIRTLDDIKPEHRISNQNIGNSSHLALTIICNERYGDARKFDDNYVIMPPVDALVNIETSNELDGVVLGFPNTLRANEIDKLSVIYEFASVMVDNGIGTYVVANDTFYNNNPRLIEIFRDAYLEMYKMIINKPEEAAQILSNFDIFIEIDVSEIINFLDTNPVFFVVSEQSYDKVANLMYEVGMIPNPPKPFSSLPNYESIPKAP